MPLINFIKTALVIGYIILSGYGLLKIIIRKNNLFSWLGLLTLSFVLGFGMLAVWANMIMLLGQALNFWILALPVLPCFIFGVLSLDYKIDFKLLFNIIINLGYKEVFLFLVILIVIVTVLLLSVSFPLHFWDSRAIWGLKAKMLYYDRTINSPNFLDVNRLHPHFRYPLLFPLAQTFIYFTLGEVDDWAVMLLIGVFFPLLILFMYELMRKADSSRLMALLGTAVLAVLPLYYLIDGPVYSGYADTPLALFFLVSFGVLYLWRLKGDNSLLYLGAILSAFLPLIKNEGFLLLILNLVWIFWPIKYSFKKYMIVILLIIFIILPWLVIRQSIPNLLDEKYLEHLRSVKVSRLPQIIGFYLYSFFGFQADAMGHSFLWGGLWVIFIIATIRSFIERNWIKIRLFWMVSMFYLFMTGIYLISPAEPLAMINNFFRVSFSITPLLVFLIAADGPIQNNEN